MAVSGDGSSMLKDMLDEIREELCVDYIELKNQGADRTTDPERPYRAPVTARLMFPEFYEEGVENTPARILETHVHGSGILYRNCFQGRKIDFYQYDNAFPHAMAQESGEFVLQLALWRLRYPKELSERARECYLDFLKNHVREYAEFLVKSRQIEEIRLVCRTLEEEKNELETAGGMALDCFLEALTEWAGKKQYAEALSFVMDYRHVHHAPVKKRARLEL